MNEILKGTRNREENDYYATSPKCVDDIIKLENLYGLNLLEPCAGELHIVKELWKYNNKVVTNDLIQRKYELDHNVDFINENIEVGCRFDATVTNPPFKLFTEFLTKSFEYTDKVILFGRIQILEGKKRKEINEKFLTKVYVYSYRVNTAKNGNEEEFKKSSSMCFCWFVYDKNKKEDHKTIVEWI